MPVGNRAGDVIPVLVVAQESKNYIQTEDEGHATIEHVLEFTLLAHLVLQGQHQADTLTRVDG